MFHRVVMNIINMAIQVLLIPHDVIPESPLPYFFAIFPYPCAITIRESELEPFDDVRQVVVTRVYDHMKVVRKNHPGDDFEWDTLPSCLYRLSEQVVPFNQKVPPLIRYRSYEIELTRMIVPSKFGHRICLTCEIKEVNHIWRIL